MDKSKRLYLNIWNDCNLSCRHCFNNSGRTEGPVLTQDEIFNLVSDAKTLLGVDEIQITGGEPTQRPDLFNIIKEFNNMGLKVLLQTNGAFGEDIREKIMMLQGMDVSIIFSLDGIETNEHLRGRDATIKTLANIKSLSKYFNIRINILLSTNLQWSEIEKLVEIALEDSILLAFNPVCPLGRADESLLMPPSKYFDWMLRLEDLKKKDVKLRKCFNLENGQLYEDINCPVRRNKSIHFSADGSVYPCGFFVNVDEVYMGNIRETPLVELIKKIPDSCKTLSPECAVCSYFEKKICTGGCPARIFGLSNGFKAKEFYCLADHYKSHLVDSEGI
jgi:radical SAM protein with 4Fe4S-binding SPASM domain